MTMVPDADQKKKSLYESRETINSLPVSIFYFDEELLWVALPLFLDSKCLPAFVFLRLELLFIICYRYFNAQVGSDTCKINRKKTDQTI